MVGCNTKPSVPTEGRLSEMTIVTGPGPRHSTCTGATPRLVNVVESGCRQRRDSHHLTAATTLASASSAFRRLTSALSFRLRGEKFLGKRFLRRRRYADRDRQEKAGRRQRACKPQLRAFSQRAAPAARRPRPLNRARSASVGLSISAIVAVMTASQKKRPALRERNRCLLAGVLSGQIAGGFLPTGLALYFIGVWFLPTWLPILGAYVRDFSGALAAYNAPARIMWFAGGR
jgi:hypothetical protein